MESVPASIPPKEGLKYVSAGEARCGNPADAMQPHSLVIRFSFLFSGLHVVTILVISSPNIQT